MTLINPPINSENGERLPSLSQRQQDGALAARAAIYALERRYLESPDWDRMRVRRAVGPLDWQLDARFVQLDRLGRPGEDAQMMLRLGMRSLLASMHGAVGDGSLIFSLGSDGNTHALRMGIRSEMAAVQATGLTGALQGHLPGSRWTTLSPRAAQQAIGGPLSEWSHLGVLTGIPSFKLDDQNGQSLERLIEALRGRAYQLLVIADPLSNQALDGLLERARALSSELHPLVKQDWNLSRAVGQSTSTSESDELNDSTAQTSGGSRGASRQSALAAAGSGLSMAVALAGMAAGLGPAAVLLGELANAGASAVTGRESANSGESWNTTTSSGRGHSASRSTGDTDTDTRSMSREELNKDAQYAETLLDKTIERFQHGRGLGFWNVGVYLVAPDSSTLAQGQSYLRALVAGKDSYMEPLRSLDLSASPMLQPPKEALSALSNPSIAFDDPAAHHPLGRLFESMGTPLNTEELSLWMNLPGREVSGVSVQPLVHFGLNAPVMSGDHAIILGEVHSPNGGTGHPLTIDARQLSRHAFITGTTGSGKTNTCLQLIRQLHARGVPFLIIEPAKTEYRALLADPDIGPNLRIFTLGSEQVSPFRLNPFEFVPGFGLLTHIDLLKATFNAAFPMYASMPYLLEEAILEIYTLRGWDLATGQNRYVNIDVDANSLDARYWPTLSDLYAQIDEVVERKQYAQQLRMDLSAALKARISSLRVGSKGMMLDVQRSIPIAELLAGPTILELQDLGDDSEKAFVMGLILTLLYEHRQVTPSADGENLQHLTVIEEAHRLLKRVGSVDNPEIANPQGRAVETFCNILAEVREYGEGILVIDQIASKLAPEIIKNTNLKIIHRIMARDDRDEVGGAINLDEAQRGRLVTLRPGEAVVHNDTMDQALLVQMDHVRSRLPRGSSIRGAQIAAHMNSAHQVLADYYRESWPAAPLHELAGCETCRARCRYGARVAKSLNVRAVLPALNRLNGLKDDNGNVSLTALDDALTVQAKAIARPEDGDNLHDLKHCLLTHYTDDPSVLNRHAGFVIE